MEFYKQIVNKAFKRLKKRIAEQNLIDQSSNLHTSIFLSGSIIEGNVRINENCKIYQSSIVGDVEVGRFTSIWGPGTHIISHLNPVTIGKFCSIARYVSIQEANHKIKRVSSYHFSSNIFGEPNTNDLMSKGAITIGNDVWVGAHAIILSGVTVGNGAVIGAGSVVTSDVPPYAIVGGNPAKVIRYRFSDELIKRIQELCWWDWDLDKIKSNKILFECSIDERIPFIN
jgi:acetyltransferase-like isoleucine patch superfamily enzyme